jgi:hypothetical protein
MDLVALQSPEERINGLLLFIGDREVNASVGIDRHPRKVLRLLSSNRPHNRFVVRARKSPNDSKPSMVRLLQTSRENSLRLGQYSLSVGGVTERLRSPGEAKKVQVASSHQRKGTNEGRCKSALFAK